MEKKKLRAVSLDCLDDDTIRQIRIWRNQDFVRKWMFHQEMINEEEHLSWISSIKKDSSRDVYVFYLDDEPLGIYQYRVFDDGITIEVGNYLINESYIELGYGTILVYAFSQIAYKVLGFKKMYSEVLETNRKVLKLNMRSGIFPYKEYINSDGNKVYCFIGDIVDDNNCEMQKRLFCRLIENEPWEDRVIRKQI